MARIPAEQGLERVGELLADPTTLVRAVAAGRRKGNRHPRWRRVEFRYVDLARGRHLQVVAYDQTQAHTSNYAADDVKPAIRDYTAEPFGNWHVQTTGETYQLRITKRGEALTSTQAASGDEPERSHDRSKSRFLPEDHPVLTALGIATQQGIKPSKMAKYRQVEEFLRELDATITDARQRGALRTPTNEDPWRLTDLGCGNAYLTLAATVYLAEVCDLPVRVTGVDVKEQARRHNRAIAADLRLPADFVVGEIASVELATDPEIVLALHACDTATDDALARAVAWEAPVILAAPCCHHDIAAQLRRIRAPAPYSVLLRDGIVRERFADTLTDSLRAELLRGRGYRVDVVEFVDSQHTPRNTLLRCVAGGRRSGGAEYADLVESWHLTPKLAVLLGETRHEP